MMKYQKIINLLDNTPVQLSKFKIKNSGEINDDLHGKYSINSPFRFKSLILKSSLCDTYILGNAYILVNGTITVQNRQSQEIIEILIKILIKMKI